MLNFLYYIYNDIIKIYTQYDIIDTIKQEPNVKTEKMIKGLLNFLIRKDEPELFEDKNNVSDMQSFKLDNSLYQLNNLRTDMVKWKKDKSKIKYEKDWELIDNPNNLPCHNYILYLIENMPENISYNNGKHTWKRASDIGFSKEVSALNEGEKKTNIKDIWMDTRLLGEKWTGLFKSISEDDRIIAVNNPTMKFI